MSINRGESIIETWAGTEEELKGIVAANERMSFLLSVSAELARIRSPQELICTAMARLRERLGAVRVTLAELDEAQDEAIVIGESGDDPSRIEVVRLPLGTFLEEEQQARQESKQGRSISVPLMDAGKRIAGLAVVGLVPREFSPADVELVRRLAEIIWPALEKASNELADALFYLEDA